MADENLLQIAVSENNLQLLEQLLKKDKNYVNLHLHHGLSPLHYACLRRANMEIFQCLFKYDVNPNTKDFLDITPLHLAIQPDLYESLYVTYMDSQKRRKLIESQPSNSLEIINLLIDRGADVNADHWQYNETPLLLALEKPNFKDIVSILLDKGANINALTRYKKRLLHWAIQYEMSTDFIMFLIKKGADIKCNDEVIKNWVIRLENIEDIKFVIKEGFNVNARDSVDYSTLLHYAAKRKNLEGVKLLVSLGAEVNAKDSEHRTPIFRAVVYRNCAEIIKHLVDNGADFKSEQCEDLTALHVAVRVKKNSLTVKCLIDLGTNVNTKNASGETPLHRAVKTPENVDVINMLLSKDAEIETQNHLGETPLNTAAKFANNSENMNILISKKAQKETRNMQGNTPLLTAISKQNLKNTEFLLEKNVNVKAVNIDKQSSLHLAVEENLVNIIKILISYGANKESKNKLGETPLHRAAYLGHLESIRLLIANGANVNAENEQKSTPLHMAVKQNNNTDVMKLLIENGADKNAKNVHGETPAYEAIKSGTTKNFIFLIDQGADVFVRTSGDNTLLHTAAALDSESKITELLLEKGAEVNALNSSEETPLHKAVLYGRLINIKIILFDCKIFRCNLNFINEIKRSCLENRDEFIIESVYAVVLYLFKLKALGLVTNKILWVWKSMNEKEIPENFDKQCKEEVDLMQKEFINEANNVSLKMILTEDLNLVAERLQVTEIAQALENYENITQKYPIYDSMLIHKLDKLYSLPRSMP